MKNINFKKYIYYFVLALAIIMIVILIPKTSIKKSSTETVPVIPASSTKKVNSSIPISKNIFNSEQKITFNWNNEIPKLPTDMDEYYITTPLINTSNIISFANKFKFTDKDKVDETESGTYLWINKEGSLFGSNTQNQISYSYSMEIPKHVTDIPYNEASDVSKQLISSILGSDFVNSLDDNPTITYLNKKADAVEEDPQITNPKENNLISISYRQKIDNIPLVTKSRGGEVITTAIDTNKNLYLINLYGGYQSISKKSTTPIVSYSELKNIASVSATRITYAKDLGSENLLSNSQSLSVQVKSVNVGYYQENNASIVPVFIIDGLVSTKGVEEYPAKYIVPAIEPTPAP